jgi:hypothetical protein
MRMEEMFVSHEQSTTEELSFSLVRDLWFRVQQAMGLIPSGRLGIIPRSVVFALVTWLPIVVWAAYWHRVFPGEVAEPLLAHFGVHVRCLIAIPLLFVSEIVGDRLPRIIIPYFVTSGLSQDDIKDRFVGILRATERLRDARPVWAVMTAITPMLAAYFDIAHLHELIWASDNDAVQPRFGFGA